MKKLLIAVLMFVASTGIFAQAPAKKDAKTATKTTTAKKSTNPTAPVTTTAATAGPTKKDGTADMRYKANKTATKTAPVGPTKKDGTADMRYKANKKEPVKKKS
ncbi:MAG: hypothetical protein ABI813_03295 [Bacteroidota bacterium]